MGSFLTAQLKDTASQHFSLEQNRINARVQAHTSHTRLLVVEVASTVAVHNRFRFKGEIYAEAGVPLYWIVNLPERRIEVYSQPAPSPAGPRYAGYQEYRPGDLLPVQIDGRVIGQVPASDLLPVIEE